MALLPTMRTVVMRIVCTPGMCTGVSTVVEVKYDNDERVVLCVVCDGDVGDGSVWDGGAVRDMGDVEDVRGGEDDLSRSFVHNDCGNVA